MLDMSSDAEVAPVFDLLDIGIIVLDRTRRIVAWNDWVARAARVPASAVLGECLDEVFPQLRGTRLMSVIAESFEVSSSGFLTHSLNTLLPLRGTSGEALLHNVIVRPLSSGSLQYSLLQISDVTVAVTRERVLRERQNARFHAIADTAPDAIITTTQDHIIQWLNTTASRVFGYAPPELLGKKVDLLLAGQNEIATLVSGEEEAVRNRAAVREVIGRGKQGAPITFEVSYGRWHSDERTFITTIWRDVSVRKAAETALRESEARFRALLEALPQLVWTCDPMGNCDYFNPQWREYAGGAIDDHLCFGWLRAVHPDERDPVTSAWQDSLARRAPFDVEVRLRRNDGAYRWFKMRSIPVTDSEGELARWLGTATDISNLIDARDTLRRSNEELEDRVAERTREREAALAQLYESQKLETIGQLTGGVAHDFNNLLAVILGSLRLLKKALPDDPRVAMLIDGAMQGAERGATLTKRLLAFARRQELKLEAVEITTLVSDLLDFLRQSIGPHVVIDVDIADDVQPVKADVNQLELALINLAVNARDAMPKGGTITIAARNETGAPRGPAPALPRGDYVRLSVADAGEGMSEAVRAKAMEPFFTTKGIGKGTGLGLSMVHGMTVQSGGGMSISSELGKGTIVTLWLRSAGADDVRRPKALPTNVEPEAASRRLRILVVDDDPLVSMNTAYMLMDLGHSVLEAHSAAHALHLLSSDASFDAVITDYAMPGMNGVELAQTIVKTIPKLPIIVATGYAELAANVSASFPRLSKPYTQEELAQVLNSVTRRSSSRGTAVLRSALADDKR